MKIKIGDKVYQAEISELQDNVLEVRVNERDYFFTKNGFGELVFLEDIKKNLERDEVVIERSTEKEIKSSIAGTISAIYVKKGEKVKPGQKILTLISMKMENEIISESSGTIKEIKVKENQSINTGETLIVFE